jgi:hypothetical protein
MTSFLVKIRNSQLFIRNTELVAIMPVAKSGPWVLTMEEIHPIACWAAIPP